MVYIFGCACPCFVPFVSLKNAQIYNLQGDDNDCTCEDFRQPTPRDAPGWDALHQDNRHRVSVVPDGLRWVQYEIVFYGDDLVENLNGLSYGEPFLHSNEVNQYYKDTFTHESEHSSANSAALGITGDTVRWPLSLTNCFFWP